VVRETTHLYFPLGAYQARLEEYVKKSDAADGWKENVLQYCRGWFKEGLGGQGGDPRPELGGENSSPRVREEGGLCWFDAVLGYISSTKEWRGGRAPRGVEELLAPPGHEVCCVHRKDNVVFHTIVFPAMLDGME